LAKLPSYFFMSGRPLRFTAMLVLTTTVFALWTDSCGAKLSPSWRQWLGFAPINIIDLQWQQSLTSLVVTAGEWKFLQSILMLTLAVGFCEAVYGTWLTVKLFFASHLVVVLALSLLIVLPAHYAGTQWGTALAMHHDVGPSAGYYGCLGAALASVSTRWRASIMATLLCVLIARLAISFSNLPNHAGVVSADLSHLMALPLGFVAARRQMFGSSVTGAAIDETRQK